MNKRRFEIELSDAFFNEALERQIEKRDKMRKWSCDVVAAAQYGDMYKKLCNLLSIEISDNFRFCEITIDCFSNISKLDAAIEFLTISKIWLDTLLEDVRFEKYAYLSDLFFYKMDIVKNLKHFKREKSQKEVYYKH